MMAIFTCRGYILIETNRFFLRKLTIEDVSDRYLSWLNDTDSRRWIVTADSIKKKGDLRKYIEERVNREDVLFLGIFLKLSNLHIGNIKYEPIDFISGIAEMGVLIGDPEYRGRSIFSEVFLPTASWLNINMQIREIQLGVERKNLKAINAYRKVGFVDKLSSQMEVEPMTLRMTFYL